METYAIWCKQVDKVTRNPIEIHFNLWRLRKVRSLKHDYFLDIGLLVSEINNITDMKLFIPFLLKKEEVSDLGKTLISSHKLINGIFNEDYSSRNDNTPKQLKITDHKNNLQFIVYKLDEAANDYTIEQKYGGTIITIKTEKIKASSDKPYYFRFRIKSSNLNKSVHKHRAASSIFESAFINTEVMDFRLNEKRTYNESLSEDMLDAGYFFIRKVHFLLLTNSNDELVLNGFSTTCRQLEKGLWESYVPNNYNLKNIVAYHWKKNDSENGIETFISLIKLKVFKSNILTILIYISIFGILTILFNIVSSIIIAGIL